MSRLFDFWCPRRAGSGKWFNWIHHYTELSRVAQVFRELTVRNEPTAHSPRHPCGRQRLSTVSHDILTLIALELLSLQHENQRSHDTLTAFISYWLTHQHEQAYNALQSHVLGERCNVLGGQSLVAVVCKCQLGYDWWITHDGYYHCSVSFTFTNFIGIMVQDVNTQTAKDVAAKCRLIVDNHQYQGAFTGCAQLGDGQNVYFHSQFPVISAPTAPRRANVRLKLLPGIYSLSLVYVAMQR